MRAARLISLVLLLQSRDTMTAAELAGELGVSERTVYRDVVALSEAGVPVYADQGRHGGYRLVGGYRTRLTGLSQAEAEALFLAGLPGPAEDLGLGDAVANARLKVLAALPPSLRAATARTGQRFHLDVPGWFHNAEPPPLLAELASAIWQDRRLEVRYRRGWRVVEEVTRELDPYGVVLKAAVWYLVGRVGDDFRTYRVDRMVGVSDTGRSFEREEGFDLAGFWAQNAARFARSLLADEVVVRISPAGRTALVRVAEPPALEAADAAAGEPDEHGWVTTRLPVESLAVAYDVLLTLGPEIEVLEPRELRDRMAEAAAAMRRLYADSR
ncbi:helix-turn-helix transcriptional regulator [Streptodolium elevatio]|uniref:YafY family protein n=1 Tax=Streptodolium elevatio TaxID=3157996 RepID=A0ABV3DEV6_9ACTN